jgi:hypothetical protein
MLSPVSGTVWELSRVSDFKRWIPTQQSSSLLINIARRKRRRRSNIVGIINISRSSRFLLFRFYVSEEKGRDTKMRPGWGCRKSEVAQPLPRIEGEVRWVRKCQRDLVTKRQTQLG